MKRPEYRPPSPDEHLDRELRDHVERQVADYIAAGMDEASARRRVRLELGGLEQAKELCRDVRRWQWLEELVRDVRISFRSLRRERLFSLSVLLILTLGIGASAAMFSVLHAIVLRPLPYANPGELAVLTTQLMGQNRPDGSSIPNLLDWREQSRSFAAITFYRRTAVSFVTFAGIDAPQRAQEGLIGPDFFEVLGAPPLLGRTLTTADFDRAERLVVLSEALWQEQFARSTDVLGRTLTIDGSPHTIVGVMRDDFQLPTRETRFWRQLSILPGWPGSKSARDGDAFEVIGRLRPAADVAAAQAEMHTIAAHLRSQYPSNSNLDVRVAPLLDHVIGVRSRRGVWLGSAAVVSLLGIACANVGGLLLARAARRQREFAVRSALGAGRRRILRQLLAENISLCIVATVAGTLLAHLILGFIATYAPAIPRMEQVRLDWSAVSVAALATFAMLTVCATYPVAVAAQRDVTVAFGARGQAGKARGHLRDWLVTGQVAVALILLVAAALFLQSFVRAHKEDPGYSAAQLLVVRLDLPRTSYADAAALAGFFRAADERIGRLPGVEAVGAITDFFIRRNADQRVTIEGRAAEGQADLPRLAIESVTPGYFDAIGTTVIDGREFEDRDLESGAPRVFIVNETLARRYWPGENAVGKRMVSGSAPRSDGRWDMVVGVVKDMRREGLDREPIATAFVPGYLRAMDMTVRVLGDAGGLAAAVRREIRAIDPGLPLTQITGAADRLEERLSGRRFETQVLALFAAIGLALSAAGLYASLAYQVTLRTREMGIRTALGADRQSIVRMVLADGLRRAAAGIAIGLGCAVGAARLLQSLLYETPALNAAGFLWPVASVLAVVTIAASIPALRAARVSPLAALRED